MAKNWYGDTQIREHLVAGDAGFPALGIEILLAPLWGEGETLARVLLSWEARWFTAIGENFAPNTPPLASWVLDVVDTAAPEPPLHARGQLGVGIMPTVPTTDAMFSSLPGEDLFREHVGSSGPNPIDLHGQRTGDGFVGFAQLRVRLSAFLTEDHPEGWYADARCIFILQTSALLLQPD